MEPAKIFIYKTRDVLGSREFLARIEANGDLVFDGWDLNKEPVGGISEYEWTWTIAANDVPKMSEALGLGQECEDKEILLKTIEEQFAGKDKNSLLVHAFLKDHEIQYKTWSWRS